MEREILLLVFIRNTPLAAKSLAKSHAPRFFAVRRLAFAD
jgi:hypothetical protein